ncbi:hypothetical protein ALC152_07180 [Arcobacter sp. 15-2]|uniref:hypothetical protein n=1 Tax=Arcobacter sp. 15-2 TaxID=3374109 RepID=UPI00399CE379
MEISSTLSTQYTSQNNVQKKTEANETFEIPKEEVIPEKEEKVFESKFLNYLGKDALAGFSEEKQKLYETILSDDKITMDEIKDLNFKETKEFLNFVFDRKFTDEDNKHIPASLIIGQALSIHSASNYTSDEVFNEAYATTLRDPNLSEEDRDTLRTEMQMNFTQMLGNEKMQVSRIAGARSDVSLILGEERPKMNGQVFFEKVFTMLNNYIDKPDIHPDLKEYSIKLQTLYKSIEDNYKEIEERNKNTTVNNNNPYFNMEYREY